MSSQLKAAANAAGALLCVFLVVESLWTGSTRAPGFVNRVMDVRHGAAAEPSQFWFMQALFLAGAAYFGYRAWREYRG